MMAIFSLEASIKIRIDFNRLTVYACIWLSSKHRLHPSVYILALFLNCHLTHNDCIFNRTCSTPIAYCSYSVLYCKLVAFANFYWRIWWLCVGFQALKKCAWCPADTTLRLSSLRAKFNRVLRKTICRDSRSRQQTRWKSPSQRNKVTVFNSQRAT